VIISAYQTGKSARITREGYSKPLPLARCPDLTIS
jgi:hypothetical protein